MSHTEIASAASVSTSSPTFLSRTVEKSWFSTTLRHHPNANSQKTCLRFFTSSPAACTVSAGTRTKSRRIRIYPTKEQKTLFKQWFGVSRKVYNASVEFYNREDKDTVNWMEVANRILGGMTEDYVRRVPYQIKKIAVKDCYNAFMNGCRKAKKTGEGFELSFRTRKDPKQTCYIPKSALLDEGIYYRIAGKLRISERGLLNHPHRDLRLTRENGRWFIVVPLELPDGIKPCSDNQRAGDVVAVDPGVRSFATYFSENGYFGSVGDGYDRILRLHLKIDRLCSLRDKHKADKHKYRNVGRKILRLRARIKDLVNDLHWKTAEFLARNFSVVIYPTYETSGMVRKEGRKLRKTVVRAMQSYRFYEFSQRLQQKCDEYGTLLIRSNEAYTSKTNSFTGAIMNIGSRKSFKYDGVTVDRDVNGARNILLRAMRDSSAAG